MPLAVYQIITDSGSVVKNALKDRDFGLTRFEIGLFFGESKKGKGDLYLIAGMPLNPGYEDRYESLKTEFRSIDGVKDVRMLFYGVEHPSSSWIKGTLGYKNLV